MQSLETIWKMFFKKTNNEIWKKKKKWNWTNWFWILSTLEAIFWYSSGGGGEKRLTWVWLLNVTTLKFLN